MFGRYLSRICLSRFHRHRVREAGLACSVLSRPVIAAAPRESRRPRLETLCVIRGQENPVGEMALLDATNGMSDTNQRLRIGIWSGLMSTPFTTLKIAVVPPMPRPRMRINPAANLGCLARPRAALENSGQRSLRTDGPENGIRIGTAKSLDGDP